MGQNPICNKILLEIFQICPFYMTLCSSWVDEAASHCHTLAQGRSSATESAGCDENVDVDRQRVHSVVKPQPGLGWAYLPERQAGEAGRTRLLRGE